MLDDVVRRQKNVEVDDDDKVIDAKEEKGAEELQHKSDEFYSVCSRKSWAAPEAIQADSNAIEEEKDE